MFRLDHSTRSHHFVGHIDNCFVPICELDAELFSLAVIELGMEIVGALHMGVCDRPAQGLVLCGNWADVVRVGRLALAQNVALTIRFRLLHCQKVGKGHISHIDRLHSV